MMPHKILIIGPSWVGDTVMAQALFKLLKSIHPDAVIDVLAPAWTFSLLKCMPEVRHGIELPITHGELKLKIRYQIAKQLKAEQYDQAIVLPNSFKSAMIPWLARIPKRTGYIGECRYIFLNDARRLDSQKHPLMVEQYLALGLPKEASLPMPYPYPEFTVNPIEQTETLQKYNLTVTQYPILALCAGAEFGPAKRWPEEYYAEVANQKLKEGFAIWLFGSKKDEPVIEKIMTLTNHRCENFAGRLQLFETIRLLSLTCGIVTNDSGLMHVAAALRKPIVALYGSTSPRFTPPLSKQASVLKLDLPCQPCFERVCPLKHHRCMLDLRPERVLEILSNWNHS